ncbi:MAG: DUF1109 domain-containing protein [Proteobacteria bacterium]|nr:DUF1109 domain-containing protein [Pseudomonadota bacterium]
MRTDLLIDRLSQNLQPVRPRSIKREALLLLVLGAIEVAAFVGMGFMRPDMPTAMENPSFWWKLASTGLIAILGAGVALISADPVRSPRHGLRWILVCVVVIFVSGWFIDAAGDGVAELVRRLDWTHGLQCVWKMAALSIPPAIALGRLIRRAAPTDPSGTALAAGLSSAAWGAFVFVFACPSDDPLYIAVWYTVGCSIVTVVGRAVLLRLSRW